MVDINKQAGKDALNKLRNGQRNHSEFTEEELKALEFILDDKVRRTDLSRLDLHTTSGLERLDFALAHHQFGYQFYEDILNK